MDTGITQNNTPHKASQTIKDTFTHNEYNSREKKKKVKLAL
jgi:hypothetical protein